MDTSTIILSIVILLISTVIAIVLTALPTSEKKVKPIYLLLAGTFLALYVLLLEIDHMPEAHGQNVTPLVALLHALQAFLLGYDFSWIDMSFSLASANATFVYIYLSILLILAPIYTFGFVLSFFESITTYLRFLFSSNKDVYVLSDLSEKTLHLATSIRKKFPKAVIVFANSVVDEDDVLYDFANEAKNLHALLFTKPVAELKLNLHKKGTKLSFFSIRSDENANLEEAFKLIEKYSARENTELYVLSNSNEGGLLLDAVPHDKMKIRRINEVRALAYSMIYETDITEHYTVRDGKKIISTLIVGGGKYGFELAKALLWCGQLGDFDLEINILDKNKNTESRFQAICPEIIKHNHNHDIGEARYDLNFHSGVDVQTNEFIETVQRLKNTSVIYVALGNDELNIETAIQLRIHFERIGLMPTIRAIVYSEIKYKTLSAHGLKNHDKVPENADFNIELIGNLGSRFNYDTIVNEALEKLALDAHLSWCYSTNANQDKIDSEIKRFNQYEYYRNSSIATAIHVAYRKRCQSDTSMIEHLRWNAYMRTEGFVLADAAKGQVRRDRAKMHTDLINYYALHPDKQIIDEKIANEVVAE